MTVEDAGPVKCAVRSAEKRNRVSTCPFADRIANAAIAEFRKRQGSISYAGVQTVLAAILVHDSQTDDLRVLSFGVGTKILSSKLAASDHRGELVRDCHAEVLARRGLMRFLHKSVLATLSSPGDTVPGIWPESCNQSILQRLDDGADPPSSSSTAAMLPCHFMLRPGLSLHLYTSSQPCGNAALKRSPFPHFPLHCIHAHHGVPVTQLPLFDLQTDTCKV